MQLEVPSIVMGQFVLDPGILHGCLNADSKGLWSQTLCSSVEVLSKFSQSFMFLKQKSYCLA